MEVTKILTADVLDIIFDGKNKSYGAYELRKTYKRRLVLSMAGMSTVILLLIGTFLWGNTKKGDLAREVVLPPDIVIKEVDNKPDEVKPPPPPKLPEPPRQMAQRIYTAPQIVQEVQEDEKPPTTDELEDVKIGDQNIKGDIDDGILAPPAKSDGEGKGIIEAPAKRDPDRPFEKVEIESKYPGGPQAWIRYLTKELNRRYPQEAIDNMIQGTVIIQFVVDVQGNVSNVEALSGPPELHEAAIAVIRKSGQWIPAIQNGIQVKSYKRQPIGFKIGDE